MYRIGLGHDTHRLTVGTAIVIGGIWIEHNRSAVGHSDADVLLHAITDAILGAAALGDIGELFPDNDLANKGRDSSELLREASEQVKRAGWHIVNLDCVVFAERPKILPNREKIREKIAGILGVNIELVWLKGKTGEGVGPVGQEQAISAECIAMIER